MVLTDEEAREIVDILRRMSEYMSDCGNSRLLREDAKPCIAILESRIGQPDLSARVRELEEALRPVLDQRNIVVNGSMVVTLCLTRDEYNRAARALK
ncbi:MAG: hypothetical protein IPJ03_17210, partial [Ignavibacteriales bacterium]|nr:hypothetical protein [Ignavibacteriales bacterium]